MQAAHSLTPPNGRLSARWLHRRLIVIYTVVSVSTVTVGIVIHLFGLDLTLRQWLIGVSLLPVAVALMLLADILVINVHYRPIGVFLRTLPEPPAPAVTAVALVRAFNLPVLTALRVALVHFPSAGVPLTLLLLLANRYLDAGFRTGQILILWLIMAFLAPGHLIFEYFAVLAAIRPVIRLIWRYCDGLKPQDRRRIFRIGMKRRMLFVSAFVVIVPLLVLSISVLIKLNTLLVGLGIEDIGQLTAPLRMWVILLIAGTVCISLSMSFKMAHQISLSTDEMVQAMRQVENEELDARLVVTTTDEFADLYEGFNRMTSGLQERERLRDAFDRYVAPELAEEVMRHGISLGGETVSASVLFADIRGFTTLSERMSPTEVVSLLNRCFAAVEPAIRTEGGWINKFGGDSLLAVFGAPVPQTDHALRAVHAALRMRAALAEFNTRQREAGGPTLRIGIGVDCGELVAGSLGSPERMEYTVIGDVVNVASRIEALNKKWGTDALISAGVYAAAGANVPARPMPPAEVQGKSEPLQVYALE